MKGYTNACDLWSIGVVTYMLITGAPPFRGQSIDDTAQQWRNGVSFGPFVVSKLAREFIQGLLQVDPNARWTAEQALSHPWICTEHSLLLKTQSSISTASDQSSIVGDASSSSLVVGSMNGVMQRRRSSREIRARVADRVKRFASFSRLKRLALLLNVANISADEEDSLGELFRSMDTNLTGRLFFDELEQGFKSAGIEIDNVKEIFLGIDQDSSGRIQYSQFLAATSETCALSEKMVRDFFSNVLDVDGDGRVSLADLKAVLGPSFSSEVASKLIAEVDTVGDRHISMNEFLETMLPSGKNSENGKADGSRVAETLSGSD